MPEADKLEAFDRDSFVAAEAAERDYLCQTLAVELTHRVREAPDFHAEVGRIVEKLRALGHPLWSFDEDDDFAIWGPDYSKSNASGIVLTFDAPASVVVEWMDPNHA